MDFINQTHTLGEMAESSYPSGLIQSIPSPEYPAMGPESPQYAHMAVGDQYQSMPSPAQQLYPNTPPSPTHPSLLRSLQADVCQTTAQNSPEFQDDSKSHLNLEGVDLNFTELKDFVVGQLQQGSGYQMPQEVMPFIKTEPVDPDECGGDGHSLLDSLETDSLPAVPPKRKGGRPRDPVVFQVNHNALLLTNHNASTSVIQLLCFIDLNLRPFFFFLQKGVPPITIIKKERRKEQNRRAARKCREKKKAQTEQVMTVSSFLHTFILLPAWPQHFYSIISAHRTITG